MFFFHVIGFYLFIYLFVLIFYILLLGKFLFGIRKKTPLP